MHKLLPFREIQAKGSAIYRDRSHLGTHETGICEFVHPRHTHDHFDLLFIAEKLTLYYEYELAQARDSLKSGDTDATIKVCEYSLMKWWPNEERALELLKEALKQANRTLDDHVAATVFGKSKLLGNSTKRLWGAWFFRRRVAPWVGRVIGVMLGVFVAGMVTGSIASVSPSVIRSSEGPVSEKALEWIYLAVITALGLYVVARLLLNLLPDPGSFRWYWGHLDDWIEGRCPWDSDTWPESFRPTSYWPD
jgi:hypothetical protein